MSRPLLALDIATTTGFALGDPFVHRVAQGPLHRTLDLQHAGKGAWPKPRSGTRRAAGSTLGAKLATFERDWYGLLDRTRPGWVVYEMPIMGGKAANLDTVRLLNGLIGVIAKLCHQMDLPSPGQVQNSTIKKHFTGKGDAQKPDMVAACQLRGWVDVTDHNEADALALFDYAAARLQKGEGL